MLVSAANAANADVHAPDETLHPATNEAIVAHVWANGTAVGIGSGSGITGPGRVGITQLRLFSQPQPSLSGSEFALVQIGVLLGCGLVPVSVVGAGFGGMTQLRLFSQPQPSPSESEPALTHGTAAAAPVFAVTSAVEMMIMHTKVREQIAAN
jgi:hypothetical protein